MTTGRTKFWTWMATGLLTVIIVVLVNMLTDLLTVRMDLTEDQRYTLSESAHAIAGGVEEPLRVNVFLSDPLPSYISHIPRVLRSRLDEFRSASDDLIEYEFVNPTDEDLQADLKARKMVPTPLQEIDQSKQSVGEYYLWLEFVYQGRRETLDLRSLGQVLLDPRTMLAVLPYQIAARIVKLTSPEHQIGVAAEKKTPPANPRAPQQQQPSDGIDTFRKGIESHFPPTKDVPLKSGGIRADIDSLVVYRPEKLSERTVYELDQFLMQGKRVLLLLDNFSIFDIDQQQEFGQKYQADQLPARDLEHGLRDWLAHYGIRTEPGYVADDSAALVNRKREEVRQGRMFRRFEPTKVPGFVVVREQGPDGEPTGQFSGESPVLAGLGAAGMLFPVPMELDEGALKGNHPGARGSVILRTSGDAWVAQADGDQVPIYSEAPGPDTPRGAHALVAEVHGTLRSYYAGKERPARTGPNGDALPEPEDASFRETSSEGAQLWVFADSDFISDYWPQLLRSHPLQPGPLPSDMAIQAIQRMQMGLVNAMDAIILGKELVEIRRPLLSDRSLQKESIEDNRDGIVFWTLGFVPLCLVAFGLLKWILRFAATRVPSPRRQPIQASLRGPVSRPEDGASEDRS